MLYFLYKSECRDLLRKLLEPRPELRLPLLEVMVHPWVTVQGTAPLVPYTEQPIDEKLHKKVRNYMHGFMTCYLHYFIASASIKR